MNITADQLTLHFRLNEFSCGNDMIITPTFLKFAIDVVEPFRQWYNRPININSGYRNLAKNKAVGGDYNSLHLKALAIDFNLPVEFNSYNRDRQNQFLKNIYQKWGELCHAAGGYAQVTLHDGWVHMGISYRRAYFDDRRRTKGGIM